MPSQRELFENKLKEFASLPPGWAYGEGETPTEDTIWRTSRWATEVSRDYPTLNYDITMMCDGVCITFQKGEHFVDVMVTNDGKTALKVEKGIGVNYDILFSDYDGPTEESIWERLQWLTTCPDYVEP